MAATDRAIVGRRSELRRTAMDEVVVTGIVAVGGGRRAAAYGAMAMRDPLRGVDDRAASYSRRWRWDSGAAATDGDGEGDRTK